MLAGVSLLAALDDMDARQALLRDDECAAALARVPTGHSGPLQELLSRAVLAACGKSAPLSGVDGAAMDAALNELVPTNQAELHQRDELLGKLLNAGAVGLFGAVYGRLRWFARIAMARTGLPLRSIALHAAKRSRVGVWVGGIMALDAALNSWLLPNWSKVRNDLSAVAEDVAVLEQYQPVVDAPARLTIPSVSAVLSASLCTVAISRQRFAVLPITMALGLAHSDAALANEHVRKLVDQLRESFQ